MVSAAQLLLSYYTLTGNKRGFEVNHAVNNITAWLYEVILVNA